MSDLTNIFWQAFSGDQLALTVGTDRIRRYAPGFPAIIAYADVADPDFAAIAEFCAPKERFFCAEWRGATPAGWRVDVETSFCSMAWTGEAPTPDRKPVRLTPVHIPLMAALAAQTSPGPFPARPMDIGEWYGIFEEGRLVALAGERAHAGRWREVSGVCTLPEFQGRGYARRLTARVVASQLARGQQPFLHVMSSNARALGLYEHMGFTVAREVPLRVVSRAPEVSG